MISSPSKPDTRKFTSSGGTDLRRIRAIISAHYAEIMCWLQSLRDRIERPSRHLIVQPEKLQIGPLTEGRMTGAKCMIRPDGADQKIRIALKHNRQPDQRRRQIQNIRDVPARPEHRRTVRIPPLEMPFRHPPRRCNEREDLNALLAVDPVRRAVAQCFTIASSRITLSSAAHAS